MKGKKYKNINALCEKLSKDSAKLGKQLADVKKKYPLVAIAYGLQKAIIKDLSRHRLTKETQIEILYSALTNEKPYLNDDVIFEQRIQAFEHCLGVAGTSNYVTIGDCIERFSPV